MCDAKTGEHGRETQKLTEDETVSLMSVGVDFGITRVVGGNWGVTR